LLFIVLRKGILLKPLRGARTKRKIKVGDFQGRRRWISLHEKGGKEHDVPCHHRLDQYLHDYLETAGIGDDVGGQDHPIRLPSSANFCFGFWVKEAVEILISELHWRRLL
jgi:hypothetical protein